MTELQIQWAKRHDWFLGVEGGAIVVLDRYVTAFGKWAERALTFHHIDDLRKWAGY